jgi:hypothetical protein
MFRIFCLLFFSTITALAADISGTWNAPVETDAGALGEASVTGTVKGQDVRIEFNAGATIIYTGKLDDSAKTITGTCDLGGQASGTFKAMKQ